MTNVIKFNSTDIVSLKAQLTEALANGPATVTFTKKDGSERVMKCTTNEALTPAISGTSTRAVNPNVLPVYDIEAQDWRSFRWDSVKSVEVEA